MKTICPYCDEENEYALEGLTEGKTHSIETCTGCGHRYGVTVRVEVNEYALDDESAAPVPAPSRPKNRAAESRRREELEKKEARQRQRAGGHWRK